MDGNSLSNQNTPISQNGYQGGAGSSQTVPDYMTFPAMEYWELLSAIVEANAEPISWTMFHLPESSEIEKQKWLNSPKARLLDLIKGGIDLTGHIGVGVFNFVAQTDVTSAPLEFRGWDRGIGIGEERSTGERIFWLALSAIPEAKLAGSSLVRSAEREVAIAARGIGSIERSGVSISSGSTLTNSQIDLSILGSSAAKGGAHYGTAGDAFLTNASRATQPAGMMDVAVHGSPVAAEMGTQTVNHRVLANLISRNSEFTGQPIRLLSCKTGCLSNGFAQNLSNKLGVPVHAPDDLIWAFPNGRLTIGPTQGANTGSFVPFVPGGNR
jgi:hypothetical protein